METGDFHQVFRTLNSEKKLIKSVMLLYYDVGSPVRDGRYCSLRYVAL